MTAISINPNVLGGTPCFRGSRVPVDTLFFYLEAGDSIDRFLEHFPTVTREVAVTVLNEAARAAVRDAEALPA